MKRLFRFIIILFIFLFFVDFDVYANTSNDNTRIWIDYPKKDADISNSLKIQGWVMSKYEGTEIEVFIDQNKVDISRVERSDVINAITEYGTIEENPTPGFYKEIDIRDLSYGKHEIKINIKNNNEVILTDSTSFNHTRPKTWINIDYPKNIGYLLEKPLKIQGWVMSEASAVQIDYYIDEIKQTDNLDRLERPDVIKAVTGFGTIEENPTPGFYKEIDVSNLSYGSHTLKIVAKDNGEELFSRTKQFEIRLPKTWINIDYPKNIGYPLEKPLKIQGWVMSESNQPSVEYYIDGIKQTNNLDRLERPDVIKAVTGFGTIEENPTPGFYKEIDISNLSYGSHTLKIVAKDNGEELFSRTKQFEIKRPKTLIHIDYPKTVSYGEEFIIQGWYLSEAANTHIEMYLDNEKLNDFVTSAREDVYKVYNDSYGRDTLYPGFYKKIDASGMSDDNHSVIIKVISDDNGKVIQEKVYNFRLSRIKGKLNIDYLEQAKNTEAFYIQGWEMSTGLDSYIKVYIDNKEVLLNINREARPDVIKTIKDYGDISVNPTPGIRGYIDISNISRGSHTIKTVLYSKYSSEIAVNKRTVNVYSNNYINTGGKKVLYYDNIPYYNQKDGRWNGRYYGLSTFGKTGCTPTSLAMAFSTILGREILPTDIGDYLYYNTNEFNKKDKGASGLAIIYATNKYHIKRTPINDLNSLKNALAAGKIVYAAMGNGKYATAFWNHGIIMRGYDVNNSYTYTIDPLNTANNTWVNTSLIWAQQSFDYDDRQGGAALYSLESYY